MVDKRSSKQPDPIPKKPPRRPSRDYTNLPQRPITLKPLKKKRPLPTPKKASVKSKSAVTRKKRAAPKKSLPRARKQAAGQWLLKGISEETKQYALEEAGRRGVTIGEWIEQLIINHRQPVAADTEAAGEIDLPQSQEELSETLHAIEERLDRIEERRGFWSRFWDQVMKQAEKQQER
ncbi:MAG: hypothetical protein AB2637_05530 [Candidatus Thiodiazotropha sp.]